MPEPVRHRHRVALIPGDGIGTEVVDAAAPVIAAAAALDGAELVFEHLPYGAEHFLTTGETLPDEACAHLRDDVDAILVGALGDPRVPGNEHARDILLGLRFRLDLYVNFRPCRLLHPDLCPLRPPESANAPRTAATPGRQIEFVIFRENTEGAYLGKGTSEHVGTASEIQIAHEVHTAPGVRRILLAALEWARRHGCSRVTMADKSNAVPAHRLWRRLFEEVGGSFPDIEREHRYVDALAMELVRAPERFQVIVTSNLFGDILSDLGAELVGGLGLAASANLHPGKVSLFEPVHGSAPPLAGKGVANPLATILTGALMLDHLGLSRGADAIDAAVRDALQAGTTTPDLGGALSTADAAWHIGERLPDA
jgi:3-isopropylmalate dehydrogenase